MHLSELTWTEAAARDPDVAVVPVGSTEQHGPHAALGTDVEASRAVADAGVATFDGEAVVTPAVPVGVAEEHRHFDGTLWVSPDTFRDYVRETVESLAHHGWDRVVVVNGHGGNVGPLRELCARLTREETALAVPFTWFDAVDAPDMGHGGPVETSLLRHVRSDLVREDRLDEAAADGAAEWGSVVAGVNAAYDTAEFSENGTVGDPSASSAERGAELLDAAGEVLATLLAAVRDRDPSRPEHR